MIRVIVCGAGGKMGTRILDLALQNKKFKVIAGIESRGHRSVGKKVFDGKVAVNSDLSRFKNAGAVVIDFTTPEATLEHLKALIASKKTGFVIGTTGFTPAQIAQIKSASEKIPIVMAPNMSVGVNVMLDAVRALAKKLPRYNIEIIEAHHSQKKDAPSGTALALAGEIAAELKRNPSSIPIHSVRAGDIVGEHTVIFANAGERIELAHKASSRDAFAAGALRAALWVAHRRPGLYSMKDVLKG